MPATPSQVVTGLKNRLATISGLRTFNYQPSSLNPPVGFPLINRIQYHGAMGGGLVIYDCTVYVIVGRYTDDRAFDDADDYLAYSGAKSVRAALEGDQTLGGIAQSLTVENGASISSVNAVDQDFLQVSLQVTVNG
jgi:hypothetical protein